MESTIHALINVDSWSGTGEVIESNQREWSGAVDHDGMEDLGLELFIPGSLSKIIGVICKSNHGYFE